MAAVLKLAEAVEQNLRDGDTVAMEGFTHLIPFAAGHEVIRQQRKGLTLIRMTPDLVYDQLIGMGCSGESRLLLGRQSGRRLACTASATPTRTAGRTKSRSRSTATLPWRTPTTRARPACPSPSSAAIAAPNSRASIRTSRKSPAPYTGEKLATVPAIKLDVAIVHAQRADREGNVMFEGIVGVQKEAVLAAKRSIVTVEEIVDDFGDRSPNAVILPSWTVSAVVKVPGGAHPSYAHGYYKRDNAFYKEWDKIARDRDSFRAWIDENVMRKGPEAFAPFAKRAA